MESYGKFIPIDISEDEELLQQKLCSQTQCRNPLRNRNKEETSSSSSSSSSESSSSSDSETDDITTQMKRNKLYKKKQPQQRKWFTIVDLKGVRPENVVAKVDRQNHVLVIKKMTGTTTRYLQQKQQGKVVRVIPLPPNICLEKLRVKVTPNGDLIVCAPYLFRRQQHMFQQHQQQQMAAWVPIHVTKKGKNVFGTQQQQLEDEEEQMFNPIKRQQRMFPMLYQTRNSFGGRTQEEKQWKGMKTQQTGTVPLTLPTQIVRCEMTGKLAVLLNVNTIGFLPQEVRVRLDKTKRVLIVEAEKRGMKHNMPIEMEQMPLTTPFLQGGICVRSLYREFVLPKTLDVTRIAFQMLPNGIVLIKLPITKTNIFHQQ